MCVMEPTSKTWDTFLVEPEDPETAAEREHRVLRRVFGEDVDLDTVDVLCFKDEPIWDARDDGTSYIVEREPPKSVE